ncbi:hypothetical protein AB0O64_37995 [Streptomyces sp. NPDC088341]
MGNDADAAPSTVPTPRWIMFALITAMIIRHPIHSARAAHDVWRDFRADR